MNEKDEWKWKDGNDSLGNVTKKMDWLRRGKKKERDSVFLALNSPSSQDPRANEKAESNKGGEYIISQKGQNNNTGEERRKPEK